MEECPFCGMYLESEQSGEKRYQCGTIITDDFPQLPQPGKDCLMRQVSRLSGELAALKAQYEKAAGDYTSLEHDYVVLKALMKDIHFSQGDYGEILHILNRPEVKAILKGGK